MQRDSQVDGKRTVGKCANARHDANCRDREVSRRQANVGVKTFNGTPYGCLVGKRFAHAHEHNVGKSLFTFCAFSRGTHNLFHNLAGCEMSAKTCLACCAESTRHCTTCLSADTHCGAVAIVHQHGFDGVSAIDKRPQELDGVALVADACCNGVERRWQHFAHLGTKRGRKRENFLGF